MTASGAVETNPVMKKPFFVMLYPAKGASPVPMVGVSGYLLFYTTKEKAASAALETLYGLQFGFEVHRVRGCDCCD